MAQSALVTGCAGFIGSHLCEALLDRGWRVTGIDNLLNNYHHGVKSKNLYPLLQHQGFRFVEDDLTKAPLKDFVKGCGYIFHQAGQPGVRSSWGEQFDTYMVNNILATQRLLEAAKNQGVRKFVFASTSSVYGSTGVLPISEDRLPAPYSPYGVTKLAAEHLCGLYHKNYGIPVVSLRYFTVYGPRQRPDMAISRFIHCILDGKPITVYGDGKQRRDFTYVDDIVKANILAAESPVTGEVFNVGSGWPVELMHVIGMLERIAAKKADLEFMPVQKGDLRDTWADIRKISGMLGFEPSTPLEKGLERQIEYIKKYI
ncbi:MAG TPA: NAD-dependent epimerase/dehydratase family protein [Clostridia bacterium]|nr:NAD-dependent epimerase/dehydratase family protein [Clostridia bacterium]